MSSGPKTRWIGDSHTCLARIRPAESATRPSTGRCLARTVDTMSLARRGFFRRATLKRVVGSNGNGEVNRLDPFSKHPEHRSAALNLIGPLEMRSMLVHAIAIRRR